MTKPFCCFFSTTYVLVRFHQFHINHQMILPSETQLYLATPNFLSHCFFFFCVGSNYCSLLIFWLLCDWPTIPESRERLQGPQTGLVRPCFYPAAVLLLHWLAQGNTAPSCISAHFHSRLYNIVLSYFRGKYVLFIFCDSFNIVVLYDFTLKKKTSNKLIKYTLWA